MQLHAIGLLAEVMAQFLLGDAVAASMHVAENVAGHQVEVGV